MFSLYIQSVAQHLVNYGIALVQSGQYEAAVSPLKRCLKILNRLHGDDASSHSKQSSVVRDRAEEHLNKAYGRVGAIV